jgi:aspartate/methionine/tyrosine aminotransferase
MQYKRMPIEIESPEQIGYNTIKNNLSESSYTDTLLRHTGIFDTSLQDLVLCYGPHAGHEGLRELIAAESRNLTAESRNLTAKSRNLAAKKRNLAADSPNPTANSRPPTKNKPTPPANNQSREAESPTSPNLAPDNPNLAPQTPTLTKEDVLLTIGAAGALFIISTSLLEPGDELVVIRPNYATNIETPKAIGAALRYIDLHFEDAFRLDLAAIRNAITPKTKYISVTYPHNPTGVCLDDATMKALVAVAEENNLWLLVDETYRDMVFGEKLPLAAEYSDKVISVSSLSKTYGLPGIRMGWIVCRNKALMETFLAAKEQIHICGSVLDEEVAFRYLQHKNRFFAHIQKDIAEKFNIVKTWMNGQDAFEWVEPGGGCVCFLRVRHPENIDLDRFYAVLLEKYGTYVGPGPWFEMPKQYMRIGFGWPAKEQLQEGLIALGKTLQKARKSK